MKRTLLLIAIIIAVYKFKRISPCRNFEGNFKKWMECFEKFNGYWILWFNTDDNSTHVIKFGGKYGISEKGRNN